MNKFVAIVIALLVVGLGGWFLSGDRWSSASNPDLSQDPAKLDSGMKGRAQVADSDSQSINLSAGAGRTVEGIVYGPRGKVVVQAEVVLYRSLAVWPERNLVRLKRIHTDQNGRFRFARTEVLDLVVEAVAEGLERRFVPVPCELVTLTVRLELGFTVKGIVLAGAGTVEPNCKVSLEPGQWSYRRSVDTVTDESGKFQFDNVPAGVARVTARVPVFMPVTHQAVTIGSQEEIRIMSDRSGFAAGLLGKVTEEGAAGGPIVGAEILVYPSTAWNWGLHTPLRAVSDEKGSYRVAGLPLGASRVVVRHPKFSSETRIISAVRGKQGFELVPRVEVKGRLIGASAGTSLVLISQDHEIHRTEVLAQGDFKFAGKYSVGWGTLEIEGGQFAFQKSKGQSIELQLEDFAGEEILLEVVPAGHLIGRVVNEAGAPIVGVEVSTAKLGRVNRSPEREVVLTNAKGEFRLAGLPPGSVDLLFQHIKYASQKSSVQVGKVGTTSQVKAVTLVRPGVIRGQVSRGGVGLVGAIVFAGRGQRYDGTAVTGKGGLYELRGIAPGSYRVKARYSTLPLEVADAPLSVESGGVTDAAKIEFPSGHVIQGVVQDKVGRPIANAYVFVQGKYGALTTTDSNGAFSLELTDKTAELLIASQDLLVTQRKVVSAGERKPRIILPMEPRTTLSMRILGLPGRRPITRGIVRFEPLESDADLWDDNKRRQRTQKSRWVEMPAGVLRMEDFPQGRSRLTIHCPGFSPMIVEVTLDSSKKALGDLLLEPGAMIVGIVRDIAGKPVAGASVMLGVVDDLLQDRYDPPDVTGIDGRFVLRGVSPDARSLIVSADGCAIRQVDLKIPMDLIRKDPLPVTLHPSSMIEVSVRDYDGSTMTQVNLWRGDQLVSSGEPDELGMLNLEVPSPGTYYVSSITNPEGREEIKVGDQPTTYRVTLDARRR